MSRTNGLSSFSANFEPQIASPLDARHIVETAADLLLEATWEANDGTVYTYVGMIVCVYDDGANNGIYYLNDADYTDSSNWVKSGGGVTSHSALTDLDADDHTQYHNDARADTWLGTKSTTDLSEGTNLYFTDERAQDAVGTILSNEFDYDDGTPTISLDYTNISHTSLQDIGSNTHAQIDSHISDSTLHFTEDSIDHTAISNIGTNTHTQIDNHIADSTIHFTEGSIDHTAISNIGTNTHAQIDSHIADSTIHFTAASLDSRYYTETELDAGQLDNRYYTETEIDNTLSDYYTAAEVDALTWTTSDITDLSSYTGFDSRYYTETEVDTWRNSVTQTEMGYLDGVTSDIQTQIDGKIDIGTPNQGDILYDNGSGWTRLTPGTSGQVLQTNGAAANPSWEDASGGSADLDDGTAQGQMSFWDNTASKWTYTETSELFWDDTNKYLGVGTSSPSALLHVDGASQLDGAVTINDSQADVDFMVKSTLDPYALFVDGEQKCAVGFNTNTPTEVASKTIDGNAILNVEEDSGISYIVSAGVAGGSLNMVDRNGGTDDKWMQMITNGGITEFKSLNDSGSDNVENILTLDLGNGNVGIGTDDPHDTVQVSDTITIFGTGSGTTETLNLGRNIYYDGSNWKRIVATNKALIMQLSQNGGAYFYANSDANNTADSVITLQQLLKMNISETVFNDPGNDVDFRVEASGSANAFFVEGGNGRVGIGTNSPTVNFEVFDSTHTRISIRSTDSSGSAFLITDAKEHSGLVFRNNGTNKWIVMNDSGINDRFHIGHTTNDPKLLISSDGEVRLPDVYSDGLSGTYRDLYIESDGQLLANTSSRRYKSNIESIEDCSWFYDLNFVNFNWKNEDTKRYGLIAEDVANINEDATTFSLDDKGNKQYDSVQYTCVILPVMGKLIQELNDRVNKLEGKSNE